MYNFAIFVTSLISYPFCPILVANQFYQSSSEEEYVIVGNDAIVKCKIPSFVADFVSVVGWQDNEEKLFYENKDYGKNYLNGERIFE
jgi:Down syndrome cell adhesion protein 1